MNAVAKCLSWRTTVLESSNDVGPEPGATWVIRPCDGRGPPSGGPVSCSTIFHPADSMKQPIRSFTVFALVALTACAEGEPPPVDTATETASTSSTQSFAVATQTGVRNARMPVAGIITAGQPTREQVVALRGAGVEHFVSLRPTTEDGAGWEEALASSEGFDFDRLPISGAGSLTRENVETFAAILDDIGDGPAVLYCASSNRVGAMLALKAHWVDGESPESALELGRSAGLSSLENPVRELLGLAPGQP